MFVFQVLASRDGQDRARRARDVHGACRSRGLLGLCGGGGAGVRPRTACGLPHKGGWRVYRVPWTRYIYAMEYHSDTKSKGHFVY